MNNIALQILAKSLREQYGDFSPVFLQVKLKISYEKAKMIWDLAYQEEFSSAEPRI